MSGLPPIKIDILDQEHFNSKSAKVPFALKEQLALEYAIKHAISRREANLYMFEVEDALESFEYIDIKDDEGLKLKAERFSKECARQIKGYGFDVGVEYVESEGLVAPEVKDDNELPAENRMKCSKWWLRKLKVKRNREFEAIAIKLGVVRKDVQEYCSDVTHDRVVTARKAGLEYLANMELIDSEDPELRLSMLEAYESSTSNPAVKKAELYAVSVGMSEYADKHGYKFQMVTITCPSKYHANADSYEDFTPKESQAYLAEQWNRINANLKDNNLSNFGIRVVEPHKDGTPHWHVWIAFKSSEINQANKIMARHSLSVDGKEKGAFSRRITFKFENKSKGSFSSYIFKYIMKTLEDLDDSHEKSWASTWGIRQVQQLGGAPIGVWRELRRIKEPVSCELMESARLACHDNDYCRFFEIQGGAGVKRNSMPVRTHSSDKVNTSTGEVAEGAYGDIINRVRGVKVESEAVTVITRNNDWIVQKIPTSDEDVSEDDFMSNPALKPEFSSTEGRFHVPWIINNNSRIEINESELLRIESESEYRNAIKNPAFSRLKPNGKAQDGYEYLHKFTSGEGYADSVVKNYEESTL